MTMSRFATARRPLLLLLVNTATGDTLPLEWYTRYLKPEVKRATTSQ